MTTKTDRYDAHASGFGRFLTGLTKNTHPTNSSTKPKIPNSIDGRSFLGVSVGFAIFEECIAHDARIPRNATMIPMIKRIRPMFLTVSSYYVILGYSCAKSRAGALSERLFEAEQSPGVGCKGITAVQ
jgi:hypothetical protein